MKIKTGRVINNGLGMIEDVLDARAHEVTPNDVVLATRQGRIVRAAGAVTVENDEDVAKLRRMIELARNLCEISRQRTVAKGYPGANRSASQLHRSLDKIERALEA